LQGASSGNPEVKAAMEEARSRVSVMTQIYQALHRQSQYSEVDARTVVGELINGFKSGVAGRNVEVRRELESVQVPTGTSLSLGLIFNEILTNASKYAFSDVDQPALSVSLRSVNGEMLELEVTDNGPGLPNAVVNGQSRGFGLSVAEAMAQQHRGSLSVENDQGAVVRVRMRLG
jgi:two-component sensor histidine kinase